MSLRRMLDRTVTVVPRQAGGTDARGNVVIVDGTPIPNVRAARNLTAAEEDLEARDQQTERWLYALAPFSEEGTPVVVDGRSRIVDGTETLEVDGTPREARRRRRGVIHHLEVIAYRIEG